MGYLPSHKNPGFNPVDRYEEMSQFSKHQATKDALSRKYLMPVTKTDNTWDIRGMRYLHLRMKESIHGY